MLAAHLQSFAEGCRSSKEYQGHGWGVCTRGEKGWNTYRCIKPIWEDDLDQFQHSHKDVFIALIHARSAFKDEGIVLENNMPFVQEPTAFIFNGELRGVKLKSTGRIGAEKMYNFILRMSKGNIQQGAKRALDVIEKRTDYLRAMNIVIADKATTIVSSRYSEDHEYFGLHTFKGSEIEGTCSFQYDSPEIDMWESQQSGFYKEYKQC